MGTAGESVVVGAGGFSAGRHLADAGLVATDRFAAPTRPRWATDSV